MDSGDILGRVTRCSTRGFAGAYPLEGDRIPSFGAFCAAPIQGGGFAIGVIYDINIEDDPLARQLAALDDVPQEQIRDSQSNRQVPVEFSVLNLGYLQADTLYYTLPPSPPLTLEPIHRLPAQDLQRFSDNLSFLSTIATNPAVPVDDLLTASIMEAARSRPENERRRFLSDAGRMLARILSGDLHRLEHILDNLAPILPESTTR